MQKTKITGLQFFAESAAGEADTGAGVIIPADAGQNAGRPTLEELGVPRDKAASYRAYKGIPEPAIEWVVPETEAPQPVAAETENVKPESKTAVAYFPGRI